MRIAKNGYMITTGACMRYIHAHVVGVSCTSTPVVSVSCCMHCTLLYVLSCMYCTVLYALYCPVCTVLSCMYCTVLYVQYVLQENTLREVQEVYKTLQPGEAGNCSMTAYDVHSETYVVHKHVHIAWCVCTQACRYIHIIPVVWYICM